MNTSFNKNKIWELKNRIIGRKRIIGQGLHQSQQCKGLLQQQWLAAFNHAI